MKLIPLLTLDSRNLADDQSKLLDNLTKNNSEKTIYVLDLYGINKDKPNLNTYQKLSRDFDIWIDSGPRNIGDIVDNFLAGATAVTLREKYWSNIDVAQIREISENKIYMNLDSNDLEILKYYDSDGLVNFKTREKIEHDLELNYLLKQITSKKDVFSYEKDVKNITYWKHCGIKGLLVDINKIQEFKKYDF